MKKNINIVFSLVGLMTMLNFSACTKFVNPEPVFEEYKPAVDTAVKRKVLIVAIEGLVGRELKTYTPTHITALMKNAKYTYEGVADQNTSGPASWTTLLTGYPSSIHHINNESYIPTLDPDHPHGDLDFKPSLINRIELTHKQLKTATVARDQVMSNVLLSDADFNNVEESDVKVKDKAISLLAEQKLDFMFTQFSGVVDAGKDGGFVISNAKYKAALDQVDSYVGEIVAAISKGENFSKENWLIVITSPHGGDENGNYGGMSDPEMRTFGLYYNKKFKSAELKGSSMLTHHLYGQAPGTWKLAGYVDIATPRVFTDQNASRIVSPATTESKMFNISNTGELTIEMKMKVNPDNFWAGKGYNNTGGFTLWYPPILGKGVNTNNVAEKGWYLRHHNVNIAVRLHDGSTTGDASNQLQTSKPNGEWFHFAIVFKAEGNSTRITTYINGGKTTSEVKPIKASNLDNNSPFTLGYMIQGSNNVYSIGDLNIADVRGWSVALSDDQVAEVSCLKNIPTTFSQYARLFAHYGAETIGKTIWKNSIEGPNAAPNLTIEGKPESITIENYATCVSKDPSLVYVQTLDLLPQVFYWFELKTNDDWKIPGKTFLDKYLIEFWEE